MHKSKTVVSGPVKAFFVTFRGHPDITNEIDPHQWSFDQIDNKHDRREGLEEVLEDAEWLSEHEHKHDPDVDALITEYRLKSRNRFSGSIPISTPW